jgi:hypothetical protein
MYFRIIVFGTSKERFSQIALHLTYAKLGLPRKCPLALNCLKGDIGTAS